MSILPRTRTPNYRSSIYRYARFHVAATELAAENRATAALLLGEAKEEVQRARDQRPQHVGLLDLQARILSLDVRMSPARADAAVTQRRVVSLRGASPH